VATLVVRNTNEVMVALMVRFGRVCFRLESGVRRLFWVGFRDDVLTLNLVYKETVQIFTFNGICEERCNKLYYCPKQKECIPVNFDGSYYGSEIKKYLLI
jgi:hypothetical protein